MKAFKSLFKETTYSKVEYVKNDYDNKKYHAYRRDGFFGEWRHIDSRTTLLEAEELAKHGDSSVVYMGLFENGKRIGMMDWEDTKEVRVAPTVPHSVAPPALEVENKYARRKSKDEASVWGKESYAPVEPKTPPVNRISRQL